MSDRAKIVSIDGGTRMKSVIDDGTREIPIENKFGKLICNIYIRPGDLSIIDRYNQAIKSMPEIVKPLENMNIKSDGTAKMEEEWETLKQVEQELYKQLNFLFDMDEAEEIFAKRNPFSSVNGHFFCELIIEAIGDIIEKGISEESAKTQRRTAKYLNDLNSMKEIEVGADAGESTDNA